MRPDSTPTDPRLFPTESNFTADLDARALDEIVEAFKKKRQFGPPTSDETRRERVWGEMLDEIEAAIRITGRVV